MCSQDILVPCPGMARLCAALLLGGPLHRAADGIDGDAQAAGQGAGQGDHWRVAGRSQGQDASSERAGSHGVRLWARQEYYHRHSGQYRCPASGVGTRCAFCTVRDVRTRFGRVSLRMRSMPATAAVYTAKNEAVRAGSMLAMGPR